MALTQNFNVNPYYDDYDETKGFNRILFRPGYAVQARELTQLQTMMQKQIERFGQHIFKEGSMVLGGQTDYVNSNVFYLKLQDNNSLGLAVDVSTLVGKFIKKVGSDDVRAYVLAAEDKTSTDPKILAIKYFSPTRFSESDAIEDETGDFTALVATSSASGLSSIITVNEGVFFINGFFAKVNAQTIFLDKYGTTPTYRIGLEVSDKIVTESEDTSLLDPALDASNYQAPGATRLKIELTLSKRTLSSIDDSKFIDLIRIENGIIKSRNVYPQYSVLEETLARRTFDESGNYTVRPFNVSFTDDQVSNNGVGFANAFNIIIGPGKAYVKGYEFETISPTTLVAERSRDFETESNYGLTINYQNFIDVTNITGPIDVKEFTPLDVHCVPHQSINTTSNVSISSTNIGTIRIRALDYQYGANTTSTSNAVYRAYIFEPKIGVITANATGGTANSITLHTNASSQNNAYYGVKLRISNDTGNSETKIIQSYNGITKVATFDSNWTIGTPSTNTIFSLDFEFKDSESFIKTDGTNNITTKLNVSNDSKYSILTDDYQGAYITEPQYEAVAFPFPRSYIKENSITNNEYFARKVYTGTFTAAGVFGSAGGFSTGSGITSAVTGTPISTTDAVDNFFVVLTSAGTTLANNSVINFLQSNNIISVTTAANSSTVTMTCPGANSATATVYMKVKLPYPEELPTGTPIRKVKTPKVANTTNISITGGENINGANVVLYVNETDQPGVQLVINKNFTANLKNSSLTQSLYVADVYKLSKVLDFKNYAVTTANIANASDITASFSLLNGRTLSAYNHSAIQLNPGNILPTGNVVIFADYYSHSGTGYLTLDSYIDGGIEYKDILPSLRDSIDFRPRLKDGLAGINGAFEETLIGISGTNFETDFSYYFPRIDKLIVTKDRKFEIIQGISSFTPKPPADRDDAMTIYTLVMPPYVAEVSLIAARFVENRRYTMRDIGEIEQRVQNLEYFSTLNFLEKTALSETFVDDSTGLSRVKTGVVTDPFVNYDITDLSNEDYLAAIDLNEKTVRPAFNTSLHSFELSPDNQLDRVSTVVSIPASESTFISQPLASSIISVNPNGSNFSLAGSIIIEPPPVLPDPLKPPNPVINLDNINGNWSACAQKFQLEKQKKELDKLNKILRQQYTLELKDLKKEITQIQKLTRTDIEGEKYQWGYKCIKGEWKWWEYVIPPDPPPEPPPPIIPAGTPTDVISPPSGYPVIYTDQPVYAGYDTGGDGSGAGGGCFLTTAMVEYLGLNDDCQELQVARMLRDEKMNSTKDRTAINLYYRIAPILVARNNDWNNFYVNAIQPIMKLVEQKRYDDAVKVYKYHTASLIDTFINYNDRSIIEEIFNAVSTKKYLPYAVKYGIVKLFMKTKLKIWKWRVVNGIL